MGRVRRSSRIAFRTIDGEAAIVTVDDRKLHMLNQVGTVIFETAAAPTSLEDLATAVAAEFEVAPDRAGVDCRTFCDELVKRKILEWAD